MQSKTDQAIVLSRTNYGESDRVVSFITACNGRVETMAKGCRKSGSKLAGGIEPLCVATISWILPKNSSSLSTLRSSRAEVTFSDLLTDYDQLEQIFKLIKVVDSTSRHMDDPQLFDILKMTLEGLNDSVTLDTAKTWFYFSILALNGQQPNLEKDSNDQKLDSQKTYNFDIENSILVPSQQGRLTADSIKVIRLSSNLTLSRFAKVKSIDSITATLAPIAKQLYEYHN